MNEQHIEEMLSALYYMIQDARGVPLASDKCMVERDKVLDMLDEIISQLLWKSSSPKPLWSPAMSSLVRLAVRLRI